MSAAAISPVAAAAAQAASSATPEDELLVAAMYHYFLFRSKHVENIRLNPYAVMAETIRRFFPKLKVPADGFPLLWVLWVNRFALPGRFRQQMQSAATLKRKNPPPAQSVQAKRQRVASDENTQKPAANESSENTSKNKGSKLRATAGTSKTDTAKSAQRNSAQSKKVTASSSSTSASEQHTVPKKLIEPRLKSSTTEESMSETSSETDTAASDARLLRMSKLPPIPWEERIKQLKHFAAGHGHCSIPLRNTQNGLGCWAMKVRANYKASLTYPEDLLPDNMRPTRVDQLNTARIAELNELKFDWMLHKKAGLPWETRYEHLAEYKKRHGNTNVPRTWKEDPVLGEWVHSQRKFYRSNQLAADKVAKLEAIGFVFQVEKRKPTWEERLEECKDFRRKHGHLDVPPCGKIKRGPEQTPELKFRRWADNVRTEMRKYHQGRQSRMTKARIKSLDDLGFAWQDPAKPFKKQIQVPWQQRFEELEDFKRLHGHCRVPQKYPENVSLGKWVGTQRWKFKSGTMLQERVDRLNAIGFDWTPGERDRKMRMEDVDDLEELSKASL